MNITTRKGEEIIKIFKDNEYVGYLDGSGDLYGFCKKTGYAVEIQKHVETEEIKTKIRKWLSSSSAPVRKRKNEERRIIEGLVKIVAITRPDTPILEQALKYLEDVK